MKGFAAKIGFILFLIVFHLPSLGRCNGFDDIKNHADADCQGQDNQSALCAKVKSTCVDYYYKCVIDLIQSGNYDLTGALSVCEDKSYNEAPLKQLQELISMTCQPSPVPQSPVCGDGKVEGDEECDKGNDQNGKPGFPCNQECKLVLSSISERSQTIVQSVPGPMGNSDSSSGGGCSILKATSATGSITYAWLFSHALVPLLVSRWRKTK